MLYSARHGQTAWNVENKICGRTDVELTEEGIRQAEVLAELAKGKNIDLIIASTMKRAMQTAGIVAEKCGIPMVTDGRLVEQCYGIYEGKDRKDPGFLANKHQFACRYPGGESMMQVAGRVYALLDEIKEKYPDRNILLVSHGGVCRVIHTYFHDMTNEEFFRFSQENAAIEEYRF